MLSTNSANICRLHSGITISLFIRVKCQCTSVSISFNTKLHMDEFAISNTNWIYNQNIDGSEFLTPRRWLLSCSMVRRTFSLLKNPPASQHHTFTHVCIYICIQINKIVTHISIIYISLSIFIELNFSLIIVHLYKHLYGSNIYIYIYFHT